METAIPNALFSTSGVIIVFIVAIVIITLVVFLFFLLKSMISNLKIKTDKFEIATQKQEEQYTESIQKTEEISEMLVREVIRRQLNFTYQYILSLEDTVYSTIYSANIDAINSTNSHEIIKLLVRYMLAELNNEVSKYIQTNHIGDTEQEQEIYIDARSKQLLYYLRVFVNLNESFIVSGINLESGFDDLHKDGLLGYIKDHFRELLKTCKDLSLTVLNNNKMPTIIQSTPTLGAMKAP